jgi:RNA polymerase sigma-70 factor, ECF subfamily
MSLDFAREANSADDTVDLLLRARRGDEQALDRLLRSQVSALRRWASGRLPRWARDGVDTSDLVQDTVVQALKHLDTFEPRGEGALQAYLRQAVINRVRNALRRAASRPPSSALESNVPDDRTSPLEAAIGHETFAQYEAGLHRLRQDERDAIVGRIELGLSYAELAAALGKPSPAAARMAFVRALVKLAKAMNVAPEPD